jgi:hypothetical protein
MFPRICIQSSISAGKPVPALWSSIELVMKQPQVQSICDQIKLLDGRDPDELARLKRQLPIITPHACRFTGDGKRKSANAVPSGLVMLDIDHIDDPRDIFSTHIFPVLGDEANFNNNPNNIDQQLLRSQQHSERSREHNSSPLGCVVSQRNVVEDKVVDVVDLNNPRIFFVAITPSCHGLRIIAERNPGESIPDAQRRIADLCRLPKYDSVTTDLARASFLMPWSLCALLRAQRS